MVSKEIIKKSFEEVIRNKSTLYSKYTFSKFQEIADKYGFKLSTYKDKGNFRKNSAFVLYDEKHYTCLDFSKEFLEQKVLALGDKDKEGKLKLEELIKGYDQLPEKNKDSVNLIKYEYEEYQERARKLGWANNGLAWSQIYSKQDEELNVITIPSYTLREYGNNGMNNYEIILAHESMHCLDYKKFDDVDKKYIYEYLKGKHQYEGILENTPINEEYYEKGKKLLAPTEDGRSYKFQYSYGVLNPSEARQGYVDAIHNNQEYNYNTYVKPIAPYDDNYAKALTIASDYGNASAHENFAEYGAMIIMGLHNPDNPKAVIKKGHEEVSYREWVSTHPYMVQYFAKELYGETISIEDILKGSVPPREI